MNNKSTLGLYDGLSTNTRVSTQSSTLGLRDNLYKPTVNNQSFSKEEVTKEESNWLKGSKAFDDGWQFGDVIGTALGSVGDIGINILAGVAKLGEGVVDAGRYLIGDVADLFGNDTYAEAVRDRAQQNTIDDLLQPVTSYLDDYSVFGEKIDQISEGVGQVGGMILTANAGGALAGTLGASTKAAGVISNVAGTGALGASAYSGGRTEAYASGATDAESILYGTISATGEVLSEMLFAGLGKGANKLLGVNKSLSGLDDVAVEAVQKRLKSDVTKSLAELSIRAGAEGVEEVSSGLISAIGKKLTYMSEEELGQLIKDENLWEQFYMGALTSAVLQAPSTVQSISDAQVKVNATKDMIDSGFTEKQLKTYLKEAKWKKEDINNMLDIIKAKPEYAVKLNQNEKLFKLSDKDINEMNDIKELDSEITKAKKMLTTKVRSNTLETYINTVHPILKKLENRRDVLIEKSKSNEKIKVMKKIDAEASKVEIDPTNPVQMDKINEADKIAKEVDNDSAIPVATNTRQVNASQNTKYDNAHVILNNIKAQYPDINTGEIVVNLSKEQQRIEEIGAAFGKQVVFLKGADFSGMSVPMDSNVLFINDKVESGLLVKTSNKNATLYALGHELWHSLRNQNPEVYSQFVDFVKSSITDEQLIKFVERYSPEQAEQLLSAIQIDGEFNLDELRNNPDKHIEQSNALNEMLNEMVANEFGGMLTDVEYMATLQQANPSLFDKVVEIIRNFFKALTKPVYKSSLTQYQITNIRNQFEAVVKTLNEQGQVTEETGKLKMEVAKSDVEKVKKPDSVNQKVNTDEQKVAKSDVEKPQKVDKKEKSAEKPKKSTEKPKVDVKKDLYDKFIEAYNKANSPEGTLEDLQRAEDLYYKNDFDKDPKRGGLGPVFDAIRNAINKSQEIKKETEKEVEKKPKKEVSKDLKKEVKKEVKLPTKKTEVLTDEEMQAEKEFKERQARTRKLAEQDRKKREAYLEKQRESLDGLAHVEIKTPEPTVDNTAKVRVLSMEERFELVNKNYERYNTAPPSKKDDLKNFAYNTYKFYRKAGGDKIIVELETMLRNDPSFLPRKKTSKFYENTVQKAPVFRGLAENIHVMDPDKIIREYKPIVTKEVLVEAKKQIETRGDLAITEFLNKERLEPNDFGVAAWVLQYAVQNNDIATQALIAAKLRPEATTSAQNLAMIKFLKKIDPKAYSSMKQSELNRIFEQLKESRDPIVRNWLASNSDGIKLTEAEIRWIEEMKAEADKYSPESDEYRIRYALINKYIADKIPKTIGQKILAYRRIAMLGNLKTQSRNFLGNAIMLPINAGVDFVGSIADKWVAKTTGIRTVGNVHAGVGMGAMAQGARQSFTEYRLGININRTGMDYTTQQGNPWSDKTVLGRFGNKANDFVNFMLSFGDQPFEEYYYQQSLYNQMRENGVEEPTELMKQIARDEAEKRTWKNNGKAVQLVSGLRNSLNKASIGGIGLGDIVMPFVMTPANLAVAMYEYSPAVAINVVTNAQNLQRAIAEGKDVAVAQRQFADSIGKLSASMALYTVAYLIAKAGITSGDEDEDADVREMMKAQGFQPFSVKIGDKSYTYDWAQPLSTPFAIMSELQRTTKLTGEKQGMFEAIYKAFSIGGSRLYEQSFLYTVKNLFNQDDPINGILDTLGTVPASFVPTLSKQLADMIDPNVKVTFDKNNKLATIWNKTAVKIPGLKSTLPTKTDVLGNEVKVYGGQGNLLNVMLNPANVSSDVAGELGSEIMDVYIATGDKTIMPQVAVKYFDADVDGDGVKERVNFTPREQAVLQEEMGTVYGNILSDLIISDVYRTASPDEKAAALTALSAYSKAKALMDTGLVGSYAPKSGDAYSILKYIDSGMTESNAVMYKSLISPIKALVGNDGKNVDGSKKGQQSYTIMGLPISDEQKDLMLQQVFSDSKYPETVSSLSNLKTQQEYIDYCSLSRHDYYSSENFSRDDYDVATNYYNIPSNDFIKYANELSNIKSDYDINGNVISNSKKNKIVSYINSLPLSEIQKVYLYGTAGYSVKQWRGQLYTYINNLSISKSEKEYIWKNLGF